MDMKIDPNKNPVSVLKNVFGSNKRNKYPNISIISFLSPEEDFIQGFDRKYGPIGGGNYFAENVCIIINNKNEDPQYFRLDWIHAEGPYGERVIGPISKWDSKYLDVVRVDLTSRKKSSVSPNKEIQDIFLQKEDKERHLCNFTPIVSDNQFALLFQFFESYPRIFTYTLLKLTYTFIKKSCNNAERLLENDPDIKNCIDIKREYFWKYYEPDLEKDEGEEYEPNLREDVQYPAEYQSRKHDGTPYPPRH